MIGLALWLAFSAQSGVPAVDTAITPAKPLAAPRAAAPMDDTCDEPVLLVTSGPARDAARMQAYSRAVAASGLYRQLGGYELTAERPADLLEGGAQVTTIVRFPCRANALAFWNSQAYQGELKALRSDPAAADLSVAIYPEAALRADMVGKVGDNTYSAAFDAKLVPQRPAARR